MEKYSARVKIRKDRVRKDGTSLLYLQVIINSKTEKINLELYWPADKFSEERLCLKREKNDKQANDYNMILREAVARANDIFTDYRLSGVPLTTKAFLSDYNRTLSKKDVVIYIGQKIEERLRRKAITEITARMHRSTLASLKEMKSSILFNELDEKFPEDFTHHLKHSRGNNYNTIWGRHKVIKTYLAFAREDNVKFRDPYAKFHNTAVGGKWKAITKADLHKLLEYYDTLPVLNTHRIILRRFLFSCFTGLRLSDLKRLRRDWLHDKSLYFTPYKTRKLDQELILPLSSKAMELLEDAFREQPEESHPFAAFTDQYSNRLLRDIGEKFSIKTQLHTHVGRETFATLYLEMGGNLEVLQKYLGHSKITTTMRYVHVDHARQQSEITRMDLLIEQKESPAN